VDAGVVDPGGTHLGYIQNTNPLAPTPFHVAMGGGASPAWFSSSTSSSTWFGILMTQAHANILLTSGASINSSGQLVSGGTTYNAVQVTYNHTIPAVFSLVVA
jgi:hypothetical protein